MDSKIWGNGTGLMKLIGCGVKNRELEICLIEIMKKQNDWQQGSQSTISSIKRLLEHQEWLKQQHQDVRNKIYLKEKGEDKPPTGFIKD